MDAPAVIVPGKKKMTKTKKWIIGIVIVGVVILGIWGWMAYQHKKSMEKVIVLIREESKAYAGNEAQVEKLLTHACDEILEDWSERKLAKKFAADMNVSYEQAIVDLAVGKLRAMKYIS